MNIKEQKYISQSNVEPGKTLDLMKWMQYFILDVLGEMIYGERHGFLERDEDVDGIIALSGIVTRYGYWVCLALYFISIWGEFCGINGQC
jgi:hypothetical protein